MFLFRKYVEFPPATPVLVDIMDTHGLSLFGTDNNHPIKHLMQHKNIWASHTDLRISYSVQQKLNFRQNIRSAIL